MCVISDRVRPIGLWRSNVGGTRSGTEFGNKEYTIGVRIFLSDPQQGKLQIFLDLDTDAKSYRSERVNRPQLNQ